MSRARNMVRIKPTGKAIIHVHGHTTQKLNQQRRNFRGARERYILFLFAPLAERRGFKKNDFYSRFFAPSSIDLSSDLELRLGRRFSRPAPILRNELERPARRLISKHFIPGHFKFRGRNYVRTSICTSSHNDVKGVKPDNLKPEKNHLQKS